MHQKDLIKKINYCDTIDLVIIMKKGFKIFLIYLFSPILLVLFFPTFVTKNEILAQIIYYLILTIIFFLYSKKDLKNNLKDFKNNFKKYLPIILKYTLSCFTIMLILNFFIQKYFITNLPQNELNNRNVLSKNLILSLPYLILLAPLLEEYVFRYSFKEIKNYYIYVITTSLLFAILHLLAITNIKEIIYIFPYFFIGFGLSNIFYKTKNYFASLVGHIIHNVLCVIIILVL